jgi:deoxyribodipyrimidine photo-lyase
MDTAIVVFTRDLRLHDNPALHQAYVRARQVVPLFVADPAIAAPPNRAASWPNPSPTCARPSASAAPT